MAVGWPKTSRMAKAEPLLDSGFQQGFKVYRARDTRVTSDLLKRLSRLDPAEWGETAVLYRIIPGK